jgi:hypothetical protein
MAGLHNDLNVLLTLSIFARLVEDQSSKYNYEINDHQCTKGYYLAYDTFPQWSTIVNTKSTPNNVNQAALQENKMDCRKECEAKICCAPCSLGYCSALCKNIRWEVM